MSINISKFGVFNRSGLNLPIIEKKKIWDIQIQGAYDLLFPYINLNFPTRTETILYVMESFASHDSSHKHDGGPNTEPVNKPTTIAEMPIVPSIVYIDGVPVRATSPINTIGYGLGFNTKTIKI